MEMSATTEPENTVKLCYFSVTGALVAESDAEAASYLRKLVEDKAKTLRVHIEKRTRKHSGPAKTYFMVEGFIESADEGEVEDLLISCFEDKVTGYAVSVTHEKGDKEGKKY